MGGHVFQEEILKHVRTAVLDDGLTNDVNQALAKGAKSRSPQDHFQLTELVNPAGAYWKRMRPDIVPSAMIRARLSAGKKYHAVSRRWFSKLPGYDWEEATLNGAYAGIPGVVGRFDHKVNGNFVEFKTYDKLPTSPHELSERHAQDIEQVSFYGALSSTKPTQNSLLYMGVAGGGFNFEGFHVRIRDMGGIEKIVKARMADLEGALAAKDPKLLPQCRYFALGCAYKESNACNCASLKPQTANDTINAHLMIESNGELAGAVGQHAKYDDKPEFVPFSWHLLAPKKGYYWWFESEEDEDEPQADLVKQGAISCIESAVYGSPLGPTKEERASLRKQEQFQLLDRSNFIRAHVNGSGQEKQLVPLMVKVSTAKKVTAADDLGGFQKGQAAALAARSNASACAMITYYRNSGKVVAYVFRFDGAGILRTVRGAVKELTGAIHKGSDSPLDDCPYFMVDSCKITNCSCR